MLTLDNVYRASYVLRDVVRKTDVIYAPKLCPGTELYLKTDNEGLFDFSLEEFEAMGLTLLFVSRDFHNTPEAEGNVMTEYESNFSAQGMPIYYARVKF